MNKYIKKSLALLLVVATFWLTSGNTAIAALQVINQTVETQNITSGLVLDKFHRFTTGGWIESQVLSVDLTNENIKVDSLINQNSVTSISTVKNLAKSSGAVAAVNGSFFDMKTGDVYGPVMSSGGFDVALTKKSTDLATFSLDELNNALFTYLDTKVELITPNGERKPVAAYNRYTGYYNNNMYIVDSKWGHKTPGVTDKYPSWMEMVVVDGIVQEFRENMPGIDVPKNGFVVMATFGHQKVLTDNFNIGDPVDFEITLNIDTTNLKMALTGGTLLVKDGNVLSNFTHNPTAANTRAPRTAVGTTADGKTLKVVTVDGRTKSSLGMTQSELAAYMKELGCTNAINFDGGGSTTMVARTAGTTTLSTVNTPSEGFERGVSASLGIFSIGPKSPVNSLLVTSYEENVFVNTSRAFTAKGLDKYLNPVEINQDEIKWTVSGVEGTFKGNTLFPTSAGEAVVTATLGDNVIGTCKINVLGNPVKLDFNISKLNTQAGKSSTFTVKGTDKNGFSASIHPSHIKWGVTNKVGTIDSNVFTAGEKGTGYVSASFASVSVYCPVSIAQPGEKKIIEDFKSDTMKLDLSASSVKASYSKASNVYKSAPYSAKLTYDFTKDVQNSRAAYINLPDGGYTLDSTTSKLGLWVYSSAKKPVWIGSMVYDKKGNVHYKYFAKGITWTGWKFLEVSLDDVDTPSKITKIYVVEATKTKASGVVYFDNLTMFYSGYPDVPTSKATASTIPADEYYKERTVSGSDSFTFSVFGQSEGYSDDKNKTQVSMLNSLAAKIKNEFNASVVVGKVDNLSVKTKVPFLSTTSGYKAIDNNGNRLIQLKTFKNNSMRLTDSNQWLWFKNQLSSFQGNNLFIFLAINPDDFSDAKEGALLKETLTDYKKQNPNKNVWVFYNGTTNSSYMERGVKYISTAGFNSSGFSDKNKSAAKFVAVKTKGNTITYQFKSFN
jgi:exopolysaccharide biosynthesis protein